MSQIYNLHQNLTHTIEHLLKQKTLCDLVRKVREGSCMTKDIVICIFGCIQLFDFFFCFLFMFCRCTVRSACQNATQGSPRWLSFGVGQQCIDFEQILPDRIPIDQMASVSAYTYIYSQTPI